MNDPSARAPRFFARWRRRSPTFPWVTALVGAAILVASAPPSGWREGASNFITYWVMLGARQHVRAGDALRVAIAHDGYLTVEGERTDAILVEAQERGQRSSVVFAQRYRGGGRFKKFATIGNAAFVDSGESLL